MNPDKMYPEILQALRGALGVDDIENDDSRDRFIHKLSPKRKSELLFQWHLGDPNWYYVVIDWLEQCGFRVIEVVDDNK